MFRLILMNLEVPFIDCEVHSKQLVKIYKMRKTFWIMAIAYLPNSPYAYFGSVVIAAFSVNSIKDTAISKAENRQTRVE